MIVVHCGQGYAPGDLSKLDRCMTKYAKRANVRLRDRLIPAGSNPDDMYELDRVNQMRMVEVVAQVPKHD